MNNFYKYLQPTIIQATMNEELPEKVRGRYFINFNVFGIQYFVQKLQQRVHYRNKKPIIKDV